MFWRENLAMGDREITCVQSVLLLYVRLSGNVARRKGGERERTSCRHWEAPVLLQHMAREVSQRAPAFDAAQVQRREGLRIEVCSCEDSAAALRALCATCAALGCAGQLSM